MPHLVSNCTRLRSPGDNAAFTTSFLDDLGLGHLTAAQRHDLLEVIEDRYGRSSTVITSQLPIKKWHDWIADPTVADAILDRLVHNAYKLDLQGNSRRKNITQD